MSNARYDIVVIGSGIAGLSVALAAAPRRVLVLTRGNLADDGSSRWAQGGIAAAIGTDDRPSLHARDTHVAGQHLNDADAVDRLTRAAPTAVDWLAALGVPFDRRPDGAFALGREAAHSRARIVHAAGDASGAAIMAALACAVRAAPHIHVREHARATALSKRAERVVGVAFVDERDDARERVAARDVVLATGGIGALYRYTTNPATADGSGLALALRAGAELADLEFVQFHPTALAPSESADDASSSTQLPLVTEALRGAGAMLIDERGRRFMLAHAREAELAPRDVVARAVFAELERGHRVYLDARVSVGAAFPQRFPTVFAACVARGLDPRTQPIPVVPAEHYHMGGVRADARGATSVAGLHAVGEVAASGVHGANRLASNSLLEGVVFGRALGEQLRNNRTNDDLASSDAALETTHDGSIATRTVAAAVANLLWTHVGLVRDASGLDRAARELDALACDARCDGDRDRIAVAQAIVRAAQTRRDSVGAHFRADAAVCAQAAR